MRRPRNIDDLAQCVEMKGETLWVFCVECNDWRKAALSGIAEIAIRQNGAPLVGHSDRWWGVCGRCGEEIEYLLSADQMNRLKRTCGVR
jgi:hypothetical protein